MRIHGGMLRALGVRSSVRATITSREPRGWRCLGAIALSAVYFACGSGLLYAGTTWDAGGGATTNINTATNWTGNANPNFTGTDVVTFGTAGATATMNASANFAGIIINRDANFTIANGAGTLTVGASGITVTLPNVTARTHIISESNLVLSASQVWSVTNFTGAAELDVSSIISDGGSGFDLTKSGSGRLELSGANTYAGKTIVTGGTMGFTTIGNVGAASSALGAPATAADGTIELTGTLIFIGAGNASSNRVINLTGGGTVNNSATSASVLTLSGGVTSSTGTSGLTFRGTEDITVSGVINIGTGGVGRTDSGTLTLSNAGNSFTGNLTVSTGTVSFNSIADSGVNSAIGAGSTIVLGQNNGAPNALLRFTGTTGGSSNRAIQVRRGTDPTTTTWTIENTVAGQVLNLSGDTTLTNPVGGTSAMTLEFTGAGDGVYSGDITGSQPIVLTKTGTGTWTVSGANTHTGGTSLAAGAGILKVTNTAGLGTGTVTLNGSALQLLNDGAGSGGTIIYGNNFTSNSNNTFTLHVANNGANTNNTVALGSYNIGNSTLNVTGANGYAVSFTGMTLGGGGVGTGILNPTSANITLGTVGNTNGIAHTLQLDGTTSGNATTGVISNSSGVLSLVKAGSSTWTLSGANTFTGTTAVNAGTLTLNYASQNNSKLADGVALTLGGGRLELSGGSHVEVVSATTLNAGNSKVTRSSGTGVLRMNAITRNPGATIDFSAASIASTTTANDASGILGSWATINGTDFATRSATVENGSNNFITAFTGYTDVTRLASGAKVIPNSATTNVRIIEGAGGLADITLTTTPNVINTLNQTSTGGPATVNPATGQTLRVNTILSGTTASALTIESTANDSILTTATASGNLTIINNSANTITVNSTISNNGAGSSLVKSGTGLLVLGGTNNFTGKTFLNGGITRISTDTGLGTAPGVAAADQLTFNGGTLQFNAGFNLATTRGITVNAAGGTIDTQGNTSTYAGVVAGSGDLRKIGSGTLTLSGANSAYAGAVIVDDGVLIVGNASALGTTVGETIVNSALTADATLRLANGITVASEPLTLNSAAAGDQRGTLDNASGSTSTWSGPITIAGDGLTTISAGGTLTINGTISGASGNFVVRGAGTGTLSSTAVVSIGATPFSKTDGGTWTVSSTGNVWGATNVNAGTLKNGVANALDSTAVMTLGQTGNANVGTYDLGGFAQTVAGLQIAAGSTAAAAAQTVTNTGAAATFTVNNTADYAFAGTITDGTNNLTLVKTGTGKLTLSGNNSFAGNVSVTGGVLSLQSNNALGTTAKDASTTNGLGEFQLQGGVSIPAAITFVTSNTSAADGFVAIRNVSGNNTINGLVELTSGNGASLYASDSGQLTFAGAMSATATSRTLEFTGAGNFVMGGTLSSGTTIDLPVAKTGTGTLTVNGNYSAGTMTVSGGKLTVNSTTNDGFAPSTESIVVNSTGTLSLGNANKIANSVVVTVNSGGTFDSTSRSDTIGSIKGAGSMTNTGAAATLSLDLTSSETFSGPITGALNLSLAGRLTGAIGTPQSFTLSNTGNSFTGNITLNSVAASITGDSSLILGASNVIPDTAVVTINGSTTAAGAGAYIGILNLNGKNETIGGLAGGAPTAPGTRFGSVTNHGAVDSTLTINNPAAQNFAGIISDGTTKKTIVTKTGAGTQTFSGASANTYTGVTTVNGGMLLLSKTAGVNAIPGNVTIGDAASNDVLQLGANNQIADASILSFNGTGTNAGIFRLDRFSDTVGALSSITSGAGIVENSHATTDSTLNLNLAIGDTQTFSGVLRDGGAAKLGITKTGTNSGFTILSGTGTQVLTGTNTYTGVTNVNWGILRIQNPSALGSTSGNTVVESNAILSSPSLDLAGGLVFDAEPLTLNGRPAPSTFFFFEGHLRNALGNNTWTGPITLATSVAANSHFRLDAQAGTLTINGGATTAIASGNVDLHLQGASNGIISTTPFNFIAGAGVTNTLYKDGAGKWTVAAAMNNLDTVTINAGTLELANGGLLGPPTAINVGTTTFTNGTLLLTKNDGPYTLVNGTLSAGTNQAVTSGTVEHTTGDATVNGNVYLSAATDTKGVYNISAGSLTVTSGNQLVVGRAGYNAVPDLPTAQLLQAELNISGTGVVTAPDVVVAQTAGTLQNSRGVINLSAGLLNAGDLRVGLVGHGTVNLTGGTINVTNPSTYTLGAGGGTSLVNQSGGVTNVTGGMIIGDGTGVPTDNVYNLSGGVLDFGDTSGASAHHGAGATPSTMTINSDGSFNFTGGTLRDITTIASGGVTFEQNDTNGASSFYIGQDGTPGGFARVTTVNGGYSLLGGTLFFDVFGADPSPEECCDGVFSQNDLLTVEGTALLDSLVDIDFEGYDPEFGDAFTLICADEIELGANFAMNGGFFRIIPVTGVPNGPMALQAIVPEPSSVALWLLVGVTGASVATKKRYSGNKRRKLV